MTLFSLMSDHVKSQVSLVIEHPATKVTWNIFDAHVNRFDVIGDESPLI
jgi:hypothetical protein